LCTGATYELASLLLYDSLQLQSKRLTRIRTRQYRYSHRQAELEVMLRKSVDLTIDRFVTISFLQPFKVNEELTITLNPASHLLGAANVILDLNERSKTQRIVFSGDVGRKNYPLLSDPYPIKDADVIVCESTYGDRLHIETKAPEDLLEEIIQRTCVDKAGRLIIPAFSVGRTQSILYTLYKLHLLGRLPRVKIFTDSAMAEQSSRIYEKHSHLLNEEAKGLMQNHNTLFDFEQLIFVKNMRESKSISNYSEPCIIISSSGMMKGGRMDVHLKKNLHNPYCTFLLIGYSAPGTPGYHLQNGATSLRVAGRDIPVAAQIVKTDIYSGHADKTGLIEFVTQFAKEKLKQVYLVHGEPSGMAELKKDLEEKGYSVLCPKEGEEYAH
jgi:metallo-beta-lactamase family protein